MNPASAHRGSLLSCLFLIAGCGPSLESSDPGERAAAVKRITDQGELATVACNDKYDVDVREIAMGRLTDQGFLAKVAIESEEPSRFIGEAAARRLTDRALLGTVAVEGKNSDVRWVAMRSLTDLVEKLTDQALLAKLAVEDKVDEVREAAVKNLTDQALLAKLAVEDKVDSVRLAAVKKLTDQAVLAKVALGPSHGQSPNESDAPLPLVPKLRLGNAPPRSSALQNLAVAQAKRSLAEVRYQAGAR